MVNLDWLRYLLAAVETGSFQDAAATCSVSPQAVSKAVAGLERHYRVRLFDRGHRITQVTPAGRTLAASARALLGAAEDTDRAVAVHRSTRPSGPVTIASVSVCHLYVLPALLIDLVRTHPRVIPRLVVAPADAVERLVATGAADVGVVFGKPAREDLACVPGPETDSIIVAAAEANSAGSNPAGSGMAGWEKFGYIVPRSRRDGETRTLDGWPDRRFPRRVVAEVDQLEVAVRLCEAGLGAAFLPEMAVRDRLAAGSLLRVADPPVHVRSRLNAIRRDEVRPTPAVTAVIQAIAAARI